MKRFLLGCMVIFGYAAMLSGCDSADKLESTAEISASNSPLSLPNSEGHIIPGQYLIQLKPSVIQPALARLDYSSIRTREDKVVQMDELNQQVLAELDAWLSKFDLPETSIIARYTAGLVGAAMRLDKEQFHELSQNSDIFQIEYDRMASIPNFEVESVDIGGSRAQVQPCGISNAGGSGTVPLGLQRWIWVVGTGIDLDHPDLNVIGQYPDAWDGPFFTPDDCNGHGTHLAGIAAAKNNSIGVIGVSAGAAVVPIRVFGCTGISPTSNIIAGLNHVASRSFQGDATILGISLLYGSGCGGSIYKNAVRSIGAQRNRVAAAAGNNNGQNAALYAPGCVNGVHVYTIASMTCGRTWSSFSNKALPPVDWIATGSSVYSTYKNGGYATLSGTGMAAAHVAGIMQLRNGPPRNGGTVMRGSVPYPMARR